MEFKDYYKVLGVERAADSKAISKAFRRLAREHHPDVNKAKGAEERFKEINEAYQVLGDTAKRARYDQMHEAYQHGGMNWQDVFRGAGPYRQAPGGFTVTMGDVGNLEDLLGGFSDFFRQFFGGDVAAAGGGRGRRGGAGRVSGEEVFGQAAGRARAEATLEITLEEAFQGARKPLDLQVNGKGRSLNVTIPKGVRTGQQIRLPGALDGGDLYLTVKVQPHPLFERHADDVNVDVPMSLAEALLGGEIEVPTLEGKVSMTIPPETQNGRVFRLRGLGMSRPDGTRGDQLVRLRVVLPTRLNEQERRFFEEMRRSRPENPRADREDR